MNIFVAGIHGVGKTYLASRLPGNLGFLHTSASKLIREERALPEWNVDKTVSDIDANQLALAAAVRRHNQSGMALLLDGHFVLLDSEGRFVPLEVSVFESLSLRKVILIEEDLEVVAKRVGDRDALRRGNQWLADFISAERDHAAKICQSLALPLHVLFSASDTDFLDAVKA